MSVHSAGPTAGVPRVLLAAVAAFAAALALGVPAVQAQQEQDRVTPARVAGEDRYDTAAQVAGLDFDTATEVFIASGERFPDALAASYAAGTAGEEHGPILLTRHRDLTDHTRQALDALDPERVFLIGGEAAIHSDVEEELEGRGHDEVVRIAGADRYETAARIAFAWGESPFGDVGTLEEQRTALMTSGEVFPDALTAGPVAANAEFPLFLTPPDEAHAAVDDTLEDLDIEQIVFVGGDAAVSSDVVLHYEEQGYETERWAGADRNETAAVVAENARLRLGFDVALTLLARGDAFPDALAGSVHAGLNAAPILLTWDPHTLSDDTDAWFRHRCNEVEVVRALGGDAAVSSATLERAVSAAQVCLTQSYIQAPQEFRSAEPPHTFEITVLGFGEPGNPAPVDIALFPCGVADPLDPDDQTFQDANNDGFADGIGTTTTGSAVISSVHGEPVEATHVTDVQPDANNRIHYELHSDADDCVIHVAFHDANGNDQLDVDGQGRPLEYWNVGQHAWEQ